MNLLAAQLLLPYTFLLWNKTILKTARTPPQQITSTSTFSTSTTSSTEITKLLNLTNESCHNDSFLSFSLQKRKSKIKKTEENRGKLKSISCRLILIKKKPVLQATFKYILKNDLVENWPLANDIYLEKIESYLKEFDSTKLETSAGVYLLENNQNFRIKFTSNKNNNNANVVVSRNHDRIKNVPLDPTSVFLQELGVTSFNGKPRSGKMASKLRQCQRFVEIVGKLVDQTNTDKQLTMVDMGCGRGYLTFSLHSHLSDKYASVKSYGVDIRADLMSDMNGIAQNLGGAFDNLQFEEGTIETYMMSNRESSSSSSLDVLIALHACDTATDDALWFGIKENAQLIVTAPCCHKEIRKQLDPFILANNSSIDHPLADVLRHGIYRERISESVTDSLRALLLEIANYDVQVFEFIGGEHTAKNVMLTATKRSPNNLLSDEEKDGLLKRFRELSDLHGIKKQKLASWMKIKSNKQGHQLGSISKRSGISRRTMPPV